MDNPQCWHFFGVRKYLGGESNFLVVEWLHRGLMDNPQCWHFFGVHKYLGGESNFLVVEWLNKGLMSASSPNQGQFDVDGRVAWRASGGVRRRVRYCSTYD
eukprot:1189013-Prorocentrum_minimum.AAC.1